MRPYGEEVLRFRLAEEMQYVEGTVGRSGKGMVGH
jgi:hypothetical protein